VIHSPRRWRSTATADAKAVGGAFVIHRAPDDRGAERVSKRDVGVVAGFVMENGEDGASVVGDGSFEGERGAKDARGGA